MLCVVSHTTTLSAPKTADNRTRTHAYDFVYYSYITHTQARARIMEATQRVIDGLRAAAAANRPMNLAHIQPADDDVISSLANVGYILRHYTARSIKRVSNLFSFSSHFQHSARASDQRPRRILAIPNTPNTRTHGDRRFLRATDAAPTCK